MAATEVRLDPGVSRPSRSRNVARLVVVSFVFLFFGLGFLTAYFTKSEPKRVGSVAHPFYNEATAIKLVIGISRSQDGLRFGEWVRQRAADRCPGFVPASSYEFRAADEPFGWYVNISIIDGAKTHGSCPKDRFQPLYLAIVRHDNGGIAEIHPQGENTFFLSSTRGPLAPVVPAGISLLDQFEHGDKP